MRTQPEGSEVEAIGSKSIIKVLNLGADMEAMNVPHSSNIRLLERIEGSTEVGSHVWTYSDTSL